MLWNTLQIDGAFNRINAVIGDEVHNHMRIGDGERSGVLYVYSADSTLFDNGLFFFLWGGIVLDYQKVGNRSLLFF